MNIDDKIRQAAYALAAALTEGGKDYDVWSHRLDVTSLQSEGSKYAYEVRVTEKADRDITGLR